MGKKSKKIILFFGIVYVFFLTTGFALALETRYPTIFGQSINDTSTLPEYACYLYALIINLAIIIAVLAVVFGGVYYLVSYGRGNFTSEAKDWIKAGISGLLIVFSSYLIAYTINPDLRNCKIATLQLIDNILPNPNPAPPPGVNIRTYQEIPIGTLTENLLTRTIDCYNFDQSGNPVDGERINQNAFGPTYLNHDRADCLVKLVDGAQKKTQVAAKLSNAITNLMNQCSCQGKCDSSCGGQCDQPPFCYEGQTCTTGACIGAACQQSQGTNDCCPTDSGIKDSNGNTISVKDQIEHGPINLFIDIDSGGASCQTETIAYKGLDEFRCPMGSPCSGSEIKNFIEEQIELAGSTISIIDKSKWNELTLLQQLTFFKEKIAEIKQKIQADKDELDKAKLMLGDCYLATPYVDLLKKYEGTNQKQTLILSKKIFVDSDSGDKIDSSKYCAGFNYSNSSCFKKCNDMCPDASKEAIDLYKDCLSCQGSGDMESCLSEQRACIKDAYNSRPCIYGEDSSQKFSDCISTCQNSCSDNCEKIDPSKCSNEYNFCQDQCNNNSECVLDNADSCLFGSVSAKNFQNCAENETDTGNAAFCIGRAYACKDGSDQYAGYPDCAEPSSLNCSSHTDQETCESDDKCIWDGEVCFNNYSASFFFTNQNKEKCFVTAEGWSSPYKRADTGTACYSSNPEFDQCRKTCPEVEKCPSISQCPRCPCDQLTDPAAPGEPLLISFSVPNESTAENAGNEGYITRQEKITAYNMVGPQCNEYARNDDPLTFYCEENWQKNPDREGLGSAPIGAGRTCSKDKEVPVGQTVDDAENWADKLIAIADRVNPDTGKTYIETIIFQMTKAGSAKNTDPIQDYCKCNARFDLINPHTGEPICKTGCQYSQWQEPILDSNGNATGYTRLNCNCGFVPCEGNPCEQIIDYLSEIWNAYRQLKIDFINFYTYMLQEPRSDIIKELSYSRDTTNQCSLVSSAYGTQTRLLSCTRIKDEIVSPINEGKVMFKGKKYEVGCYGADLGKLIKQPLIDNWFCCQEQENVKNPPLNSPLN